MRVIFVRHGKTSLGAAYRFQSENTPLSERGIARVDSCAEKLAHEHITKVYTSTYERAVETAQRIAVRHHLVPHEHAFFAEKFNGTAIKGRSYISVPFFVLGLATIAHFFVRRIRYADEETLDELWVRIGAAKSFLEDHTGKEEGIVVVSHALWIAAFLGATESVRPRVWRYSILVARALSMQNTQSYIFDYDPISKVWNRVI